MVYASVKAIGFLDCSEWKYSNTRYLYLKNIMFMHTSVQATMVQRGPRMGLIFEEFALCCRCEPEECKQLSSSFIVYWASID